MPNRIEIFGNKHAGKQYTEKMMGKVCGLNVTQVAKVWDAIQWNAQFGKNKVTTGEIKGRIGN